MRKLLRQAGLAFAIATTSPGVANAQSQNQTAANQIDTAITELYRTGVGIQIRNDARNDSVRYIDAIGRGRQLSGSETQEIADIIDFDEVLNQYATGNNKKWSLNDRIKVGICVLDSSLYLLDVKEKHYKSTGQSNSAKHTKRVFNRFQKFKDELTPLYGQSSGHQCRRYFTQKTP